MSSNEDIVEICSSDDENNRNTINDNKLLESKHQPSSLPMESQSILNGYENSSHTSLVSQPETNRKLQITVEDTAKTTKVKSTKIVIEIDEEMSSQDTEENNQSQRIMEANRTRASKIRLYGIEHKDEDFSEQFVQLLELCLKYEFSDGMMRILNKSMIPYYKSADKKYIESLKFKTFLESIINRITNLPHRKFSALKDLCDTLKKAQPKKRVDFVTLKKTISEKRKRKLANLEETPKKARIVDVVDLDQLDESAVIDLDTLPKHTISDGLDESAVIDLDLDTLPKHTISDDLDESAVTDLDTLSKHSTSNDVIIIDDEQRNCCDSNKDNSLNEMESDTISVEQKKVLADIKILEQKIKFHKDQINYYDEMEVDSDSIHSPYIVCDLHQAEILKLYKKVCELSGQSPVPRKSKTVKLTVKEGHPSGPAKKLEEWLKKNADDAWTDPPFPDFIDVVKCVSDSIAEDGLSWSKEQILSEARLLFTECGRALQKRRQEREYRDLVSKVKGFDVDKDPAEDDPLLLRRLEENKTIANKKEAAIIEEYVKMETYNSSNRKKGEKKIVVLQNEPATADSNAREVNRNTTDSVSQNNNDFSFEVPVLAVVNIFKVSPPDIQDSQKTEVDVKPALAPRPIDSGIIICCSDSEDYTSSENEASDFELDDVIHKKTALNNDGESTSSTNDFAQSIVITNVKSVSQSVHNEANTSKIGNPSCVITNFAREPILQASDDANISGQVAKTNSTPTLQNDCIVPTEANTNEPTFVITNVISESTFQTIPADNRNIISDQIITTNSSHPIENDSVVNNDSAAKCVGSTIKEEITPVIKCESNVEGTSRNPDLIVNYNDVIVKTESGLSSAEETLKMLVEFEKNSSIKGISVKTTIFDFDQEPIVCIEISSSESESDSGDENGTDGDENGAADNENGEEINEQCKKDNWSEIKDVLLG